MPQYVLVNRRSGIFNDEAKIASRASVRTALGLLSSASVIADHRPTDPLARHVVLFDADASEVAAMRTRLPPGAILEPAVRRSLHRLIPTTLQSTMKRARTTTVRAARYELAVTAGGAPLPRTKVMLYLRGPGGQIQDTTVETDAGGKLNFPVPEESVVAFVEPIPYAGFWTMLAEAPASGGTVDCVPIATAKTGGEGWWHDAMDVPIGEVKRGAGIRVGVIDTGCGPHRNLRHVTLVGAFVDGKTLPPEEAMDVAEHGTHTSGIIGARPTRASDYAGIAAGCDLFHARVFKGEGPEDGPTQADIINAIDSLSREHRCDLINMSLGGGPPSEAEEDAIRDAAERGTLCICSAGNSNGAIEYPAAYPECAAVSALGKAGWAPPGTLSATSRPREAAKRGRDKLFLAAFSCFGPTLACTAPGVGIVSTVPDRNGYARAYMEMDGTSMASPAACGALAVILSRDKEYKTLPRDISRSRRAALVLAQHSRQIGLPTKFEGHGLPTV